MNIPRSRIKNNGKVDIWDLGPVRVPAPVAPKPPELDKIKDAADKALAEVEYEDAVERYKRDLRAYGEAKKEHSRWHEANGGPVRVELWAVDASHALDLPERRHVLDLPRGVKPGPAQIEADRRAAIETEEMDRARSSDPQFGARATGAAA